MRQNDFKIKLYMWGKSLVCKLWTLLLRTTCTDRYSD